MCIGLGMGVDIFVGDRTISAREMSGISVHSSHPIWLTLHVTTYYMVVQLLTTITIPFCAVRTSVLSRQLKRMIISATKYVQ